MSGTLQKKTGGFLVSALIGLIIISFMFTGYQTMQGAPDTVATVGSHSIKYQEFRSAYDRQVQMYSQYMNGGKPMSAKQLKDLNINQQVINGLVNRKLLLNLAERVGVEASPDQIRDEIKDLPYFKTNEKFDINRYKMVLANARISPSDFEEDVKSQTISKTLENILGEYPLSKAYVDDIISWKKNVIQVSAVKVNKLNLRKYIPVSSAEVKDYLAKKENLERAQSRFMGRKASLDQKAEVKARHILVSAQEGGFEEAEKEVNKIHKSVNRQNFASLADKHSQDPGNDRNGKKQGGSLGWFGKGRMVPEFEKTAFSLKKGEISQPVKTSYGYHIIYVEDKKEASEATFDQHRDNIARELIREDKNNELDKVYEEVVAAAKKAIDDNKMAALIKLRDKYEITFQYEQMVNQVDGKVTGFNVSEELLQKLFAETGKVHEEKLGNTVNLYFSKTPDENKKKGLKFDPENVRNSAALGLSRKLRQDLVDRMKEEVPVSINKQLL